MQPDNGLMKVIPKWLSNRFSSSSSRRKRYLPSKLYSYSKHSNEAFYGVYFDNSSLTSLEKFVYNPSEKVLSMNPENNMVNNKLKRAKMKSNEREKESLTSLVRVALTHTRSSHISFSVFS